MRPPDDDPETADAPTNETTETTETTEESDASSTAAAPLPQSTIPAPTLRFLLHNDTPLWRFGH